MKGKIISIINNKGGVGKTTLTVNLAHALSQLNKKILVVDVDSQCNATSLLIPYSISQEHILLYEILESSNNIEQAIVKTKYKNIECIINVEETATLEFAFSQKIPESYKILRKNIREFSISHYDFTLIDCPPNMGFFVISALFASDFAIVPVLCGSSFSIDGLTKAIKLIGDIQENGNPDLKFLRLLINAVDKRTAMSKIVIDQLLSNFKEYVFKTQIRISTLFQQAEHLKRTILEHAPNSIGSKAYKNLAKELCSILEIEST